MNRHKGLNARSIRTWDLKADFDLEASINFYDPEGKNDRVIGHRYRFEEGLLVTYIFPRGNYSSEIWIGTKTHDFDNDRAMVEPISRWTWERDFVPYILEDLDPVKRINLDGEFDADDIELAEMFMEECK